MHNHTLAEGTLMLVTYLVKLETNFATISTHLMSIFSSPLSWSDCSSALIQFNWISYNYGPVTVTWLVQLSQ